MRQTINLAAKEDYLHRTYSQGYGAKLLFQTVNSPAPPTVSETEFVAGLASDFALWKVARSYQYDVLQVISVRSHYPALEKIPSGVCMIDIEISDPSGYWSDVGYDSSESTPSRASSGAESIFPDPLEVSHAAAEDSVGFSVASKAISTVPLSSGSTLAASDSSQDLLLPWDL